MEKSSLVVVYNKDATGACVTRLSGWYERLPLTSEGLPALAKQPL